MGRGADVIDRAIARRSRGRSGLDQTMPLAAFSNQIAALYRRSPAAALAFLAACAVTLFFAVRFGQDVLYWRGHEDKPIQPWMTVHYIARSWDVNPSAVDAIVGLSPQDDHAVTLQAVAARRGVPVADVVAQVEGAIGRLKAMNHRGGPL